MNRALKVVGIVLAVLIVILVAVPLLINVNDFRPRIESELSTALGRQVSVGDLRLSILSGSVSAENLSIADDPAFSKDPFIRAKALNVGVELIPLIVSKSLHVTNLTLDGPQVVLLRSTSGKWNFSSLGTPEAKANTAKSGAAPEASSNPNLSVAKLVVKDGRVTVGSANSSAPSHVYDKLNASVQGFSFTSQFPFTLTAGLPGGGSLDLEGKAGPIDASDASLTPLDAKLNVKQLDLGASGFVEPSTGISGLADFSGSLSSNGKQLQTAGTADATKLKLSPKGSPASIPVQMKYAIVHDLQSQAGQLTEGDVMVGKSLAKLSGGYRIELPSTVLTMKLNADGMAVNDLEAMLPALGVILPSGSSLQGGTLNADLTIVGPTDKLVIDGPVKLTGSKLAGFSLGSKLAALSKLTGSSSTGSDTVIQNFSANAHVAPSGITTDNVNLTVPSFGVLTGNGTISASNALSYKMNASLSGIGGNMPFTIEGTTANPRFVPDVKGMLTNQLKSGLGGQNGSPANALGGLFGKKKPK